MRVQSTDEIYFDADEVGFRTVGGKPKFHDGAWHLKGSAWHLKGGWHPTGDDAIELDVPGVVAAGDLLVGVRIQAVIAIGYARVQLVLVNALAVAERPVVDLRELVAPAAARSEHEVSITVLPGEHLVFRASAQFGSTIVRGFSVRVVRQQVATITASATTPRAPRTSPPGAST